MYMEIVAVTFENAQKHINAVRGHKCVLISVKTSRMYTDCQGRQRKLFFIKIILSKTKLSVKLSLNSSISHLIKSVSAYLLITSIRADGQDVFSRRFAYVQTFVMRYTLNSWHFHVYFLVFLIFDQFLNNLPFTPTTKCVVKISKREKHQILQSMAT